MSRKTIDVATLISRVNGMLAAPSPTPEARIAIQTLASAVLHETGNYRGFRYVLPGGEPVPHEDVQRGQYDKTRVRYLLPRDGKTTGREKTAESQGKRSAEENAHV